jgi:glycerol uptake facilitator-like aquaporin
VLLVVSPQRTRCLDFRSFKSRRTSGQHWGEGFGEVVATFGLVLVIALASRFRADAIPIAVAAFITSAYWFTSSTSFANPAVTFARAMTDTFAGISPESVPLFVCGQLLGGGAATLLGQWLLSSRLTSE